MTLLLAIPVVAILALVLFSTLAVAFKLLVLLIFRPVGCAVLAMGMLLLLMLIVYRLRMASETVQVPGLSPRARVVVISRAEKSVTKSKAKSKSKVSPKVEAPSPAEIAVSTDEETPAVRPKWVDAPDGYVGDVYEMTIMSGPYATDHECTDHTPAEIMKGLEKYVADVYQGGLGADRLHLAPDVPGAASILGQVVSEGFAETRETSFGPMRVHYARLSLGANVNRWLDEQLHQTVVGRRVEGLGVVVGSLLAALAALWVGLKIAGGTRPWPVRLHHAAQAIILIAVRAGALWA